MLHIAVQELIEHARWAERQAWCCGVVNQLTLLQARILAIVERYLGKRPIGYCHRCGRNIYTSFAAHDGSCEESLYANHRMPKLR